MKNKLVLQFGFKKFIAGILLVMLVLQCMGAVWADSWTCANCGTENTSSFCGNCGAAQPVAPRAGKKTELVLDSDNWYCLTCGNTNTTNFCTGCGEKRSQPVGNIISFGVYNNEPLEWIVCKSENNTVTLITRYILTEEMQYDVNSSVLSWEECDLRQYLNNSFLNNTFTAEEQEHILKSDNGDKVYIMSLEELEFVFHSDAARGNCAGTVDEWLINYWTCTKSGKNLQKIDAESGSDIWVSSPDGDGYVRPVIVVDCVY